MNTFGDRLRQARSHMGLSQDALADRMEVSKSAISAWENNRESPSFDKLVRMRASLETSLDELICGDASVARMAQQFKAIAEGHADYSVRQAEPITRDELRLLRRFRRLPEKRQRGLLALLTE